MGVYKRNDSDNWWYRFVWQGQEIRESTKQTNKRVAEQMEAARKTQLAKGEVGLEERKPAPTLAKFFEADFLPFIRATFAQKIQTRRYYENGVGRLLEFAPIANRRLDAITSELVGQYVAKRQADGLEISSINRELQVLRRAFHLAQEWERVSRALPRVKMLPGENRRERILSDEEENAYLQVAAEIGQEKQAAYERALTGIRATRRGQQPIRPDAFLLRDVVTVLMECAMRPEEVFRLQWVNVRDGFLEVLTGKTANARRRIPLSNRVTAILEMRRAFCGESPWVFPAPTQSGHIGTDTLKKQHAKACELAGIPKFPLYTLRHTTLTKLAPAMDPWALSRLAGHQDMSITKRYVHPQLDTIKQAMERAGEHRGRHDFGHREEKKETEES